MLDFNDFTFNSEGNLFDGKFGDMIKQMLNLPPRDSAFRIKRKAASSKQGHA